MITDDDDRPQSAGQIGQTPSTVDHLQRRRRRHRGVLRDGWFRTEDRGRLDGDGFRYFAARRADVIRRHGENIATWDVEQVPAAMPGVLDAAATRVPSELTEEDVFVAVSVTPESTLTAPQARAWCLERLPRHAVPRCVRVIDDLPRNAATK
ncbi:hypothetical protein [Nonomuraea sp. NPDC049141]|uniref:AMP-binding enzyme n=1 Tax=Nonomuraea sp. NPDC049141 TaxID=3155500 RepID=UPI0033E54587